MVIKKEEPSFQFFPASLFAPNQGLKQYQSYHPFFFFFKAIFFWEQEQGSVWGCWSPISGNFCRKRLVCLRPQPWAPLEIKLGSFFGKWFICLLFLLSSQVRDLEPVRLPLGRLFSAVPSQFARTFSSSRRRFGVVQLQTLRTPHPCHPLRSGEGPKESAWLGRVARRVTQPNSKSIRWTSDRRFANSRPSPRASGVCFEFQLQRAELIAFLTSWPVVILGPFSEWAVDWLTFIPVLRSSVSPHRSFTWVYWVPLTLDGSFKIRVATCACGVFFSVRAVMR